MQKDNTHMFVENTIGMNNENWIKTGSLTDSFVF